MIEDVRLRLVVFNVIDCWVLMFEMPSLLRGVVMLYVPGLEPIAPHLIISLKKEQQLVHSPKLL